MFASTSADAEERLRNLVDTTGADASSPASTGAIVSLEVCSSAGSAPLVVGMSATAASALCVAPSSPAAWTAVRAGDGLTAGAGLDAAG